MSDRDYKPPGYHDATPYLVVKDAEAVLEFLQQVFDAEVVEMMKDGDRIMHCEFRIGESIIMMGNASDGCKLFPAMLYIYVKDTDSAYQKAIKTGAKSIMEPQDQFYGDRNADFEDCCGNQWWLATNVESVSGDELQKMADNYSQNKD